MRRECFLSGILFALAFPLDICAQDDALAFERLSVEQGLSQSTVNTIIQDRRGFLWLGTNNGLNRYDGYDFTVYKSDPENAHTLSSNIISVLYEDRDERLWIGTHWGGLNLYVPETDEFISYLHDPGDPHSLSNDVVRAIYEDRSGSLWIGTDVGLNRLEEDPATVGESGTAPRNARFSRYYDHPSDPRHLPSSVVSSIAEDRDGHLWVGTQGGGVARFNPQIGRFTRLQSNAGDADDVSQSVIWSLLEDRNGQVWIGTNGGGLNRFDPAAARFTRYLHPPDDPLSTGRNIVYTIYEDRSGNLWIGTDGGGLVQFDRGSEQFAAVRHDPENPASLSSDVIRSIYEDRSGNLWIGTPRGVNKLEPDKRSFLHFQNDPDDPGSLSQNLIRSIYEDRTGRLWIGTDGGGLNRFDRAAGTFSRYRYDPGDPHGLPDDVVLAIHEDNLGFLWLGTYRKGLSRYDPATGRFTVFQHDREDPTSLSANFVRTIYEDRAGELWIGTVNGGLNRLVRENGHPERFISYRLDPSNPHSINNNVVLSIHEDRRGRLWVGTHGGGLNLLDRDNGLFYHFKSGSGAHSLSNNIVHAIHEDASGSLWVATARGLNRLVDAAEEAGDPSFSFVRYTTNDGLPGDVIYGILEDESGSLWLSTNRGLSRFSPATGTFKNFDVADGLQGLEFAIGAYHKGSDGTMYFGGNTGFNAFHPTEVRDYAPPLVITDLKLSRRSGEEDPDRDVHPGQPGTDGLILPHDQSSFTITYALLNYTSSENRYSYRLEGHDTGWHDVGAQRSATFTGVPPGKYVFVVRAFDEGDDPTEAALSVTISAPLWQTWWLRITVLVLMLAGGIIVYGRLTPAGTRRAKRTGVAADTHANGKSPSHGHEEVDHILVAQKDKMSFVQIREVLYIESVGHYSMIVTADESYLSSYTMSDLEQNLGNKSFIRSHRSYMVNVNFIDDIVIGTNGTHRITLTSGQQIPLSRRRISHLKTRYGIH